MTNIETATIEAMAIPNTVFRLRWRFIFADGRQKVGIWNGTSPRKEDSAWAVNKEGLGAAVIEGENIYTQETKELLAIDGSDYAFAQWEAYSKVPGLGPLSGSWRLRCHIYGLTFFTNDKKFTVWINGKIESRPLTDQEKKFKFKEHSAGV